MGYETEIWPFIPAKTFKSWPIGQRKVRVVVMHDMEFPERMTAAEDVARYFQHPDYPSSAHICVDNDSIIQCVKDSHEAAGAPGCNHDGIHIELAGYGKQTKREWWDKYSLAMLAIGADAAAQYCLKYNLPPVHLTNQQLERGEKGIVGHAQVSAVYKKSTHTDPGPNFPWEQFMVMVQNSVTIRRSF